MPAQHVSSLHASLIFARDSSHCEAQARRHRQGSITFSLKRPQSSVRVQDRSDGGLGRFPCLATGYPSRCTSVAIATTGSKQGHFMSAPLLANTQIQTDARELERPLLVAGDLHVYARRHGHGP